MNILLIGGSGFVGRNIFETLNEEHQIFNLDIVEGYECDGFLQADIRETDKIINFINENNIDEIVYLTHVFSADTSVLKSFEVNVQPLVNLLDNIDKTNVKKFIYLSSGGTVYGENNGFCNENDMLNPISTYGWCKGTAEKYIHMRCLDKGIDYLIIRAANPFGKHQNINAGRGFVTICILSALNNEDIMLVNGGMSERDFVFIDDFNFIFKRLHDVARPNNIYNLGSGVAYSLNEIVKIVEKVTGTTLEKVDLPVENDLFAINRNVLDMTKTLNECNIKLDDLTSMEDAVRSNLEYVKDQLSKG